MSIKPKATIQAEIISNLPDNDDKIITAEKVRTRLLDLNDSTLNIQNGGLVVQALTGYVSSVPPTDDKHFAPKKYIDDAISGIGIGDYYSKTGNNFGADAILGLTSNHNLSIYTNNAERIKITSTGLVAVAQKLLVGDTDTSLLSTRDFVNVGSGNTSGSDNMTLYNSDFGSPILRLKNDGALLLSTALQDTGGVDIMDIPNRTFKSSSGADRVDCNGAGLYFSGLRLDWQNRLFLGQWTMDDEDLKFNLDNKGPILKDRTLGTYHRLVLNAGVLSIEAE